MVELQSCGSLVNASYLYAIEDEMQGGENANNVIAEVSAELLRERQKNSQLMERISILESQMQGREKDSLVSSANVLSQNTMENKCKKIKVARTGEISEGEVIRSESQMKHCIPEKDTLLTDRVVNWMRIDEADVLHSRMVKDRDCTAHFDDTDHSAEDGEEEDINFFGADHKDSENTEVTCDKKVNINLLKQDIIREVDTESLLSSSSNHVVEPSSAPVEQELPECVTKEGLNPGKRAVDNLMECQEHERKETALIGCHQEIAKTRTPDQEIKRCSKIFLPKKPSKIAFCPKEVRRIMESKELSEENAQSHSLRKIIVFASLGIRHGCEDMYELDFNHFSILRKGEPYLSSDDPGEHVLYENPGISRKIFYPNRKNPILCPVQILEEEKAMRPPSPDASCPSCLFLCIKYGGRTRNIPQTEYVRQRMGRNKLKSLGPAICQMAKLVHIRGGSFFFKALGITLLFMAGFSDGLVQREAEYRNLDLLHKYYRTDEDAEGEELFLSRPNHSLRSPQLFGKTTSKRSKCKRRIDSAARKGGATAKDKSSIMLSTFSHPETSSQFYSKGTSYDLFSATNPQINTMNPNFHQCDHSSHSVIPPFPFSFPASGFVPMNMLYWHHPSSLLLPCPHPSLHSFRYPQPCYGSPLPNNQIPPQASKDYWKNHAASENADTESNCCSSNTEPKKDHSL